MNHTIILITAVWLGVAIIILEVAWRRESQRDRRDKP